MTCPDCCNPHGGHEISFCPRHTPARVQALENQLATIVEVLRRLDGAVTATEVGMYTKRLRELVAESTITLLPRTP